MYELLNEVLRNREPENVNDGFDLCPEIELEEVEFDEDDDYVEDYENNEDDYFTTERSVCIKDSNEKYGDIIGFDTISIDELTDSYISDIGDLSDYVDTYLKNKGYDQQDIDEYCDQTTFGECSFLDYVVDNNDSLIVFFY